MNILRCAIVLPLVINGKTYYQASRDDGSGLRTDIKTGKIAVVSICVAATYENSDHAQWMCDKYNNEVAE